ncbi:MAG: heme NO-binding domain-containing protein, partial [Cyanobacteria bacterium J06636_27]
LDSLHSRVGVSFPKLQPPSFEAEELEDDTLNLQYHSTREGLAPMVVGLVKGLGKRFDTEVDITPTNAPLLCSFDIYQVFSKRKYTIFLLVNTQHIQAWLTKKIL